MLGLIPAVRRTVAVALVVGLGLAAAGCGGDDSTKLPKFKGSSSSPTSSTSPSAQPSATPVKTLPKLADLKDGQVVVSRITAGSEIEQAAAQAWIGYWSARIMAFTKADATLPGLGQYASGQALSTVISYVNKLKSRKLHDAGGGILAVNKVSLTGEKGTIQGCMYNNTVDVDSKGRPTEQPDYFLNIKDQMVKQGGAWRVSRVRVTTERCKAS